MSCYLRHMTDVLAEAGIQVTKENRKQVDQAVRQAVGTASMNCSATWKEVKARISGDAAARQALVEELRRAGCRGTMKAAYCLTWERDAKMAGGRGEIRGGGQMC